jgi:hypothetical protein
MGMDMARLARLVVRSVSQVSGSVLAEAAAKVLLMGKLVA